MSKIDSALLPQNYELLGQKIVDILQTELDNQFDLQGIDELKADVELERFTAPNQNEYSLVTVRLADINSDNKSQDGDQMLTNTIIIGGFVNSANTDDNGADTLSALKVHRLMGVIRSVLLNPAYASLDLPKGVVRSVDITSITPFNQGDTQQSMGVSYGEIRMEVGTNETSSQISLPIIQNWHTTVCVGLDKRKIKWEGFKKQGLNYKNNFLITN